jgi:hypothetical protein
VCAQEHTVQIYPGTRHNISMLDPHQSSGQKKIWPYCICITGTRDISEVINHRAQTLQRRVLRICVASRATTISHSWCQNCADKTGGWHWTVINSIAAQHMLIRLCAIKVTTTVHAQIDFRYCAARYTTPRTLVLGAVTNRCPRYTGRGTWVAQLMMTSRA